MNFGLIDGIIIVVYLIFTIWIGIRAKRFVENEEGYYVAGRKVRLSLGVATLVATEIGTVTFVTQSELGYITGFACFFIGIVGAIGFLFLGKTGFMIARLRKLQIMTIPEFYEIKYNKTVRIIGGTILFLSGVLNMGIFLKFDGLFLTETMGFNQNVLFIIMTIMLFIVILYTILGGMLSVVVTDFLQFVILSIGMLLTTLLILKNVNLSDIAMAVSKQYGESGFNPITNTKFGWMFIIWILIGTITTSGLAQPVAAKSFSSESPEVAKKVFFYYGFTLAGRSMIPMFWGIAALAILGPNLNPTIAMPRLIGMIVPSGLLGLIIAGMLAASMSTYSAYLLSWSSVATRDVISPLCKKRLDEKKSITVSRIISCLIGVFLLFFGLYYELPSTAFQYLALTAIMYSSSAFSCVACGLYWKKSNSIGAYVALAVGAFCPISFLIFEKFQYLIPPSMKFLLDINFTGLITSFLPLVGMILGSLLTQNSHPPKILSTDN